MDKNTESPNLVKLPAEMVVTVNTGKVSVLKDDSSGPMEISGWASTEDMDLENHVVLAEAFEKHFDEYKTKGRYWYNHNPNQVIGRVVEATLSKNGFYVDKAILSDTKFNREYIIPLIKDGALNEHSVQFYSLDNEYDRKAGILYHKEVRLVETSIVSVACNPSAVIENFKSLVPEGFQNCTLDDLMLLEEKGMLKYPSEVKKNFFFEKMTDFNDSSESDKETLEDMPKAQENTTNTIDLREYQPSESDLLTKEAQEERKELDVIGTPSKRSKNYADAMNQICLAKSTLRDNSYILPIADMTKEGPVYNQDKLSVAISSLLGLKGGYLMDNETKLALFDRVFKIYGVLGMDIPMLDDCPLDELTDEDLVEVRFKDVTFKNGEDKVAQLNLLESTLTQLDNTLKSDLVSDEEFAPKVTELFAKYFEAGLTISVGVTDWSSAETAEQAMKLMELLKGFLADAESEKSLKGLQAVLDRELNEGLDSEEDDTEDSQLENTTEENSETDEEVTNESEFTDEELDSMTVEEIEMLVLVQSMENEAEEAETEVTEKEKEE